MKIYIATKYTSKRRAKKLMKQVRGAGHSITVDWTKTDQKVENNENSLSEIATMDAIGVSDADALLLLTTKHGGRGMYTELGIAIARKIPTIVIGRHLNNIFYFMPECVRVKNNKEALKALAILTKVQKRIKKLQ